LPYIEVKTAMKALILLAEDERDIRDLLVIFLELGSFRTVAVADGREAVTQAINRRPDLILLDVRMPHMDGLQACAALKGRPDTCDIPIVFLSAFASKQDIEQGLAVGAERYLAKPIDMEVLNQQVIEVLKQARSRGRRGISPQ
jgi:CheY-like chemotaxis protein